MMKILYFGTAQIAADILKELTKLDTEVVGVVSQPDRIGNRNKIQPTPVKQVALELGLKLFQPNKSREIVEEIQALKPDLILTCAYGEIIGEKILNIPKYKCVNIHASLLPKYRGAAPIQFAILNNEKETGITLMYMDKSMDTGDIIVQEKVSIEPNETFSSLYNKLTVLGKKMIKENIHILTSDNVKHYPQDNDSATYTKKIEKVDEKINWSESAIKIDCLVRALFEKPIAYTTYGDTLVKIHEVEVVGNNKSDATPGTIIDISKHGILVNTGSGGILIKKIQLAGKNPTPIASLLNGKHIFEIDKSFTF